MSRDNYISGPFLGECRGWNGSCPSQDPSGEEKELSFSQAIYAGIHDSESIEQPGMIRLFPSIV